MAIPTRLPEPEFTDSAQLRQYCNDVRRVCHAMGMALHIGAAEIEAALSTIPPADRRHVFSKAVARRRARKVARHMRHAAECMVSGGAASVRTWGAFRAEFAPEL